MKLKGNILKIFLTVFLLLLLNKAGLRYAAAQIINDSWSETTSLDYSISNHTTLTQSNNIYVINGSSHTGATHQETLEGITNQNGTVSSWQAITNLNPPLIGLKSTSVNNLSFVAGGLIDAINGVYTTVPTVSFSIFSNGQFGSWVQSNKSLPSDRAQGELTEVNDKLYYLGGYQIYSLNGAEYPKNETFYSGVNAQGNLTGWENSTPLDPLQPKYYIAAVETGKKILTIGGKYDQSHRFSRDVWQANVNSDGTLGQWEQTYPLPDYPDFPGGYNSVGAVRVNDYIVVVGGAVPGLNQSNKAYFTKITPDGGIEPWQTSQNNLPIHSTGGTLEYSNGYLYYIGGFSNELGGYHNKVFFTKLNIPDNPEQSLNVPDLKQYSLPWGPQIYDDATKWSNDPTIKRWGCALTSGTMSLNFLGFINETPETMNNYLNSTDGGYIPNGLVSFPAIASYTFNRFTGQNDLEFSYVGNDRQKLSDLIDSEIPPIVKLKKGKNTHFIVVTGKAGQDDYYINDPDSSTNTLLSQAILKWGNIANIGKFTPSHTDVSYLVFYVDDSFNIKVYDPAGQEITNGYTTEEPLSDSDGNALNSQTLNALYIPKPVSGEYKVEILGSGPYSLYIYAYDINGNSYTQQIDRVVDPDTLSIVLTDFDKNNASNLINTAITYDSLISQWKESYANNFIPGKGLYMSVLSLLTDSQKHLINEREIASKVTLKLAKALVENAKTKVIEEQFQNKFVKELTLLQQII